MGGRNDGREVHRSAPSGMLATNGRERHWKAGATWGVLPTPRFQRNANMDRRIFLGLAGLGSLAGIGVLAASNTGGWWRGNGQGSNTGSKSLPPGNLSEPVVEISLTAVVTDVALRQGPRTQVWGFRGALLRGHPSSLQATENSYLGPTIRVRRGQTLRVHFTNELAEDTIVHWHGLHVPASMDGHPSKTIAPGHGFVYEFVIKNRAGTYWYHAHPADKTGPQVYHGLAGLLLVGDDEEDRAGLPTGEFDVPLVLQDRTFDSDNQL